MKNKNVNLSSLRRVLKTPYAHTRRLQATQQSNAHSNTREREVDPAFRTASHSGNALIFILIAIALLGLLTVSMSRSGSNTNDTGSYERDQIAASEILTYAKSIENAVQSLLARDCSENEISFENNLVAGYENLNAPNDNSCHIFNVAGAGLTYQNPNTEWLVSSLTGNDSFGDYYVSGTTCVYDLGSFGACWNNGTSSDEELILFLPYLKENICKALSSQLINQSTLVLDALNQIDDTKKFTGMMIDDNDAINANGHRGKPSNCYEQNGSVNPPSGTYVFYHVLHAR